MKKFAVIVVFFSLQLLSQEEKRFVGEIADSSCALNVHSLTRSHKEMLQGRGMGKTAADCSRICVEHYGSHYVLEDKKQNVFNLDDQKKAADFAGAHVIVTGNLVSKDSIHVVAIENEK
ncbi:MAG TPA: DUF5818 domain-containing protein [Terriglobales bacterium]|nr:DUF5818 domain-containing protein [Terriglobales bacterium]